MVALPFCPARAYRAIYIAAYGAEGRYLLRHGTTPGKEYTLFYARHPYLEKMAMVFFLGLLACTGNG